MEFLRSGGAWGKGRGSLPSVTRRASTNRGFTFFQRSTDANKMESCSCGGACNHAPFLDSGSESDEDYEDHEVLNV